MGRLRELAAISRASGRPADRPSGAGLAALLAAADGHHVALITTLADNPADARLTRLLSAGGVRLYPLPLAGGPVPLARWGPNLGLGAAPSGPGRRRGGPTGVLVGLGHRGGGVGVWLPAGDQG